LLRIIHYFLSFRYRYDIPGRLSHLDIPDDPAADNPFYFNLARYLYNQNSLISSLRLNAEQVRQTVDYLPRNWIFNCYDNLGIFSYSMDYFPNGNVYSLQYQGSYNSNFGDNNNINFTFGYDKSNRLLNAISNYDGDGNDLRNTYDKDGNILSLKRYLHDGSEIDNFNYTYYSGKNWLKNTGNVFNDYEYDLNGNLVKDDMNKNVEIKYDHRNLITFIKHLIHIEGNSYTQVINYYYDEAGNRIRKVIMQSYRRDPIFPQDLDNLEQYPEYDEETFNQAAEEYYNQVDQPSGPGEPEPGNGEGDNPFLVWYLVANEFYIRGVEGNELVILEKYSGVEQVMKYNFFGSGSEGYIDAGDRKYFYLKDHLGSVRVILNENNEIVSAQDYDMWGYLMAGRGYNSNLEQNKYKFTGKERDKESNYDYFGARYYDARIGRWGQVDPSYQLFYGWTPYKAFMDNPLKFVDSNGKFDFDNNGSWDEFEYFLKNLIQKIPEFEYFAKALSFFTGFSISEVKEAFSWENGPKIVIEDLYDKEGAYGIFDQRTPDTIYLDSTLVSRFELSAGNDRIQFINAFFVSAIIMHEFVHFGRFKNKFSEIYGRNGEPIEFGNEFEMKVFGRLIRTYEAAEKTLLEYKEKVKINRRYNKSQHTDYKIEDFIHD
jgi:RHS repeat-associated protein